MTLVKAKTKATVNQRKMTASHHRKSKKYMKPYWPYIPIALILGGSVIGNNYLPDSLSNNYVASPSSARIDSVIGGPNKSLSLFLLVVLVGLMSWFVFRHYKRIKKLAIEGEQLLAGHFMLDVLLSAAISTLYILLR